MRINGSSIVVKCLLEKSSQIENPTNRWTISYLNASTGHELAEGDFQQHLKRIIDAYPGWVISYHWNPASEEEDEIGDEESTTTVLVAEVGEAPDVAEPDRAPYNRKNELSLFSPFLADQRTFAVI